jgi:hypothetical protein
MLLSFSMLSCPKITEIPQEHAKPLSKCQEPCPILVLIIVPVNNTAQHQKRATCPMQPRASRTEQLKSGNRPARATVVHMPRNITP